MADPLVGELAGFARRTFTAGIPDQIEAKATRHLLDTLGVAIAALGEPPVVAARRVAVGSSGNGEAAILGGSHRVPAATAALVNGTMAHALDYDDTHLPSVLHPSAAVVPAALAVAETVDASGPDFTAAVAVGDEIACRLGMAAYDRNLGNSIFFEKGLHATSICGTIGAAAACSLLLGGDTDTVSHSMAVAASMGAGLLEANRTGGSVKPVHCGWAAHSGVMAAQLASAGVTGPRAVLEGRFGFFQAYTDGVFDEEALIGGLGERWELERLFVKPYPTNHFTHAGIDAALELRDRLDPEAIAAIELGVPGPVLRTIAQPASEKMRPKTGHQAKFSGPFTVATALLGGGGLGVDQSDFTDEAVLDGQRLRLAALVRCVEDERASQAFPHQFPAVLRITKRDGSIVEHRVEHNRGGPDNPLSDVEMRTKFRLNAAPVLGSAHAEEAADVILRVPELSSVRQLIAVVRGDP